QPVEQPRLLPYVAGQGFERGAHPAAVGAFDDDDHVIIVAELGEVGAPALLVVLVLVHEVAALGAVIQAGAEGGGGHGGGEGRDGQDGAGEAAAGCDEGGEQAWDDGGLPGGHRAERLRGPAGQGPGL